MSKLIISGNPLPNMPWEDRPEGQRTPLWRCSKNPIIPRDLLPTSNSIFNSAVVPFGEGFAGVFRCDDTNRRMVLHVGFSKDGVNWNINEEPLRFECDNKEIGEWVYGYDPRVCFIEDRYYVTWCNGYHGPTMVWLGRRTSRHSTSLRMLSFPITVTACSSPRRSTVASPCSHVLLTPVILRSATSSTASHLTWSSGDVIVT